MKPKVHPEFNKVMVNCACGNSFESMSTSKELKVEVCSSCHPFLHRHPAVRRHHRPGRAVPGQNRGPEAGFCRSGRQGSEETRKAAAAPTTRRPPSPSPSPSPRPSKSSPTLHPERCDHRAPAVEMEGRGPEPRRDATTVNLVLLKHTPSLTGSWPWRLGDVTPLSPRSISITGWGERGRPVAGFVAAPESPVPI